MDDVVSIIKELLVREYLQRDVYETYSYWLFGLNSPAIQSHLEEHMKQEMRHIRILQRYLMDRCEEPFVARLPIPVISRPKLVDVLKLNLKLEDEAIERYTEAIEIIEKAPKLTSLRIDLENILTEEQEHVHDLKQWLIHNGISCKG